MPDAQPSLHADAPLPRVLGDSALQSATLESVASAVRYHAWLTALARPYLGIHPLEIGSGLGDYAATWLEAGVPRITVSEADATRLTLLHDRFDGDVRVDVSDIDMADPPHDGSGQHSAVVAFNVLEHIPDDVGALRGASRLLTPGGAVIMFVPAFEFAMSDFDREVGHVRRYRRATLRAAYESAGLTVERLHFVNAPGLLAWFVGMRLLHMTPGDGAVLRVWDRVVVPIARRLESVVRPPFGQSLFAVGRVPAAGPA